MNKTFKHLSPAQIIALGFASVILIGSVLAWLMVRTDLPFKKFFSLAVIISVWSWAGLCRSIRVQIMSLKERELLTFAAIASLGGCEPQVKAHAAGNLAVGTTRRELIDAIVVMLPYIGFPKSLNALAMVNEAAPAA